MESIPKMVKKITKIFKKETEEIAIETKFKQKESKLGPEEFLESLLTAYLVNPKASLEDIRTILQEKYGIKISKQGLSNRFNTNGVKFLSSVFNKVLKTFVSDKIMVPEIFKHFTKVELLDSSILSLPENLKDMFTGFGGGASKAALRLQTKFNWTSGQIDNIDITPATKNDQGYKGHLKTLTKGTLLLQDLGYFSIDSFKKITEQEAYFISRYKSNVLLFDPITKKEIDFVARLKDNEDKKQLAFDALICADELFSVRFIMRPVPEEVYKARLKKAKAVRGAASRKKELKERTKYLYKWDIYITNIPEEMIANSSIFIIYKLRWQVELLFKLFKGCSGIDKIAGKTAPRIICEIYIKLILSALVMYFTKASALEEAPEISFTKAFNRIKTFGSRLIKALSSAYLLKKLLGNLISILNTTATKERKRKKKPTTLELLEALT